MTTTGEFRAATAPGALLVEHCDIPDGMTLCEWRRHGGRAQEASTQQAPVGGKPARRGLRRAFGRS